MNKVKITLMNIAKKNLMFRKLARSSLNIGRYIRYKIRGFGQKTDEHMILFSSFNGKSYADSPKAIYKYILNDDKYKDYKLVWVFKEIDKYKYLEENENTIIIKQGTKEHEQYLAKAKYWFCNHRVLDHQYPKKNQVYVQCWHGTPLKKLGFDLTKTDNALNTLSEMQYRYNIDAKKFKYMLSPSKFATEKFISAFNLKKLKKEKCVVEKGYPRNDFLKNYTEDNVKEIKEKLGINKSNKKIILYAPTWRDNQHEAGIGYTYKTELDFGELQSELGQDYIILFRAHYFVANKFDFEKYKGFVYNVSDIDDINELYVISDMLITDYSSVFFDYANLKRPIIYYMYDFDMYKNDMRGFYINLNELPGNIVKTEKELIDQIKNTAINFKYNEKYERFNKRYNYLDDGSASKRVIQNIVDYSEGGL